jgi:hypothetical protein
MSPLVAGTEAAKSWHDARAASPWVAFDYASCDAVAPASEVAGVHGVGPGISIRASPIRYGHPSRRLPVSRIAKAAS